MKILSFAEQRDGKFKKSAFEVTQAARRIADQLGNAELITLVIGDNVESILPELGAYGASRVLVAQDARLHHYSTTAYAKIVSAVALREQASMLFLPASQMGKDLSPRLAAKFSAGVGADCTNLRVDAGEIIATRPIYAGKALVDVRVSSPMKIFALRPNVFTASSINGASVTVENVSLDLSDADFGARVTGVKIAEGRERLEALLYQYEQDSERGGENFLKPDVPALRRELGLE